MLTALRKFFDQHIAAPTDETEATAEQRARVAAAALLVEVVRSDEHFSDVERQGVLASVRRKFGLAAADAEQLLALAEVEAHDAHDLYQFTSRINATFPPAQKVRLVEELWRAAYADAVLHKHEEYMVRRVADLLHVPHSAFIAAKLRVLDALGKSE